MTYYVEWGDGDIDEGFIKSGEEFNLSHSWTKKGNYDIRVQHTDEFGAKSDWGILEITMPQYHEVCQKIEQFGWFYKSVLNKFFNLLFL